MIMRQHCVPIHSSGAYPYPRRQRCQMSNKAACACDKPVVCLLVVNHGKTALLCLGGHWKGSNHLNFSMLGAACARHFLLSKQVHTLSSYLAGHKSWQDILTSGWIIPWGDFPHCLGSVSAADRTASWWAGQIGFGMVPGLLGLLLELEEAVAVDPGKGSWPLLDETEK